MTEATEKPKTRTITMTNAAPVKIREDQWPVIAHGNYEDYDSEFEVQSNRTTKINIRVRQNADGRSIVYGVYDYITRWQGERSRDIKTGRLVDEIDVDLPEVIRAVGMEIMERLEGVHPGVLEAVDDCIADLPAVEI